MDKKILIILISGGILYLVWTGFHTISMDNAIKKNPELVGGFIKDFINFKGSYSTMVYRFCYNKKIYTFYRATSSTLYENFHQGNTRVWIAMEKNNPDNNRPLPDEDRFHDFNLKIEDTINYKEDSECAIKYLTDW